MWYNRICKQFWKRLLLWYIKLPWNIWWCKLITIFWCKIKWIGNWLCVWWILTFVLKIIVLTSFSLTFSSYSWTCELESIQCERCMAQVFVTGKTVILQVSCHPSLANEHSTKKVFGSKIVNPIALVQH